MRQNSVVALLILVVSSIIFSTVARAEEPVVITRLTMRDRVISITSGLEGLQYSVLMKDGTVLAANLSEAQLAQKHPDVYEQVRPAIAGAATLVPIWAGM